MRMMRLRGFLLFALSSLIVFAHTARADTVVVTADRMIDVIAGRVIDQPRVTVVDGRITAVETGSAALPEGARRVDLPGVTLLPGLIDMHVHLTSDPPYGGYTGLQFTDRFWIVIGVPNAKRTLEAGFTTVRNVGSERLERRRPEAGDRSGLDARTAHRSGDRHHRRHRRALRFHVLPAVDPEASDRTA